MKIYDFSYDYSKLIDLPESNSEKIWQRYFAQLTIFLKGMKVRSSIREHLLLMTRK